MSKGIIVQKYGGSSVAGVGKILNVAKRVVNTRRAGYDVVVIVSALGDTTDKLMDMALKITTNPPDRELDMLLATGEQVSCALLAPVVLIVLTVLCFNFLGDGLRDAADPYSSF